MGELISNTKAENLFWLGRYVQRVYIILHLLRKYRDVMIDENEGAYHSFCEKLGIADNYKSSDDFLHDYVYDKDNPDSLISMLTYASNNATLLREEIKSETFSYILMSISHIESCAKDSDIDALQTVSDYLLAFWGSVDERMFKREPRNMVKAGKYLEDLDLHVRFDYPHERILYLVDRLEKHAEKEKVIFNQILLYQLKIETLKPEFDKLKVLDIIKQLFVV
ncbi:MAG: alpha-E domain-containing protein [Dysgonamonadaceae bacterium]|jgi:uncharacterized alpha-E superfamily protein|nr:alpha-E domain-containing protein [Dysgonamonadaceae bacterium]